MSESVGDSFGLAWLGACELVILITDNQKTQPGDFCPIIGGRLTDGAIKKLIWRVHPGYNHCTTVAMADMSKNY